jgi:hypothetical protein
MSTQPDPPREPAVWNAVRAVLRAAGSEPPVRRSASADPAPMAWSQEEGAWEDGTAYFTMRYEVPAAVDAAALERAIREVARRHEVLRTIFPVAGGAPAPRLLSEDTVRLEVVDCATREEAERRCAAETSRVLELDAGPLVAFTLLRIAGEDHLLLATFHHLVFDGWSLSIFAREVSRIYDAFAAGRPSPLPEPALQYADYARWQHAWMESDSAKRQLSWWKRTLEPVPLRAAEPPLEAGPVVRFEQLLDGGIVESIRRAAERHDTTPFVVALAAFERLIHACCGREELCVCTLYAGRSRPELLDVIGCFTNALAIPSVVRGEMSLSRVIAELRDVVAGAFAHPDLPLEVALQALRRTVFPMQLVFLFQNVPAARLRLGGVDCPQSSLPHPTADYALMLYLTESPQGIHCEWYGQPRIIRPGWLAQLAELYESALREWLAAPDAPCAPIACDAGLKRALRGILRVKKRR